MKKARWILALVLTIALAVVVVPRFFKGKDSFTPKQQSVSLEEGSSFVPQEVLAPADSLKHAEQIAATYGVQLKSYAYGIAVFVAPNPEHAVELSKKMQGDGIPPLSLNLVYTTTETDSDIGGSFHPEDYKDYKDYKDYRRPSAYDQYLSDALSYQKDSADMPAESDVQTLQARTNGSMQSWTVSAHGMLPRARASWWR